ncbi:uncharacterized protein LOC109133728 [Beta vulgaris subsp. vulgaris]|uniref:uncharacterized protein LOC109133728 n=1 Tax=Beta vulgaris subsp. vulgaris TaxID=3555 RepID=UPI002036C9F9|nr:uncharacterized protein LOC109133728 [Beta vulgaris subsp. vulgaris]
MSHDQQVSTFRKRTRDDNDDEMELIAIVSGFIMVVVVAKGGLVTTRNVTILEIVAFFLHTLAHDLKNRTIGVVFTRSGETVSRQFHTVLKAVMKIGNLYIKQVDSSVTYDGDNKWKWFEGELGALDGTLIKMTVAVEDRPRYRDRKGDITTNILATCDPSLRFNYVLPGWEGSASDPHILGDALRRPNGLKVPKSEKTSKFFISLLIIIIFNLVPYNLFNVTYKYLLVDLGYSNAQGFLAPYKGTRYHFNLWRGTTPTNYKEVFNLRHSSARNTIERAFGLLKKRWAILRKSIFYEKQTQVRIINACFVLHNFVREENMDEENLLYEVDEDLSNVEAVDTLEDEGDDFVSMTQASPQWNDFRDQLAKKMFREYQARWGATSHPLP